MIINIITCIDIGKLMQYSYKCRENSTAKCVKIKSKVEIKMNIPKILETERKLRGLTKAKMAKLIGVTTPEYENLIKGKCDPSYKLLLRINSVVKIFID